MHSLAVTYTILILTTLGNSPLSIFIGVEEIAVCRMGGLNGGRREAERAEGGRGERGAWEGGRRPSVEI